MARKKKRIVHCGKDVKLREAIRNLENGVRTPQDDEVDEELRYAADEHALVLARSAAFARDRVYRVA